jgi:hypothetical protein
MKDPVTPLAAAVLFWTAASFCPAPSIAAEPTPVVVELFTSQGCDSCPPADVVLGELTKQADVLPLSFHITYWDRLGWPDTFGLQASTERQQAYARYLGLSGLYTPQMVVGGRLNVVGSERGRVFKAIELLRDHPQPGPAIKVARGRLELGAGGRGRHVWLMAFDRVHDVAIEGGENRGRTIRYRNVVRTILDLGSWDGKPITLSLPLARLAAQRRDAVAVLVQRESDGVIVAAERVDLSPRSSRQAAIGSVRGGVDAYGVRVATDSVSSPRKHW